MRDGREGGREGGSGASAGWHGNGGQREQNSVTLSISLPPRDLPCEGKPSPRSSTDTRMSRVSRGLRVVHAASRD